MATQQAIAAVSLALKGILELALPKATFLDAKIKLMQAADVSTGMTEGISLLLYRVGINTNPRNLPPRTTPTGERFRPSLPVDLYYLLSAWAPDADRQQHLLGWAMRLLEDTPVIAGNVINPFVPEVPVFRADESVELICDPLPMDQWLSLWQKLDVSSSMTYVVRMVQLDSGTPMPDAGRVRQRRFEMSRGPASTVAAGKTTVDQ